MNSIQKPLQPGERNEIKIAYSNDSKEMGKYLRLCNLQKRLNTIDKIAGRWEPVSLVFLFCFRLRTIRILLKWWTMLRIDSNWLILHKLTRTQRNHGWQKVRLRAFRVIWKKLSPWNIIMGKLMIYLQKHRLWNQIWIWLKNMWND